MPEEPRPADTDNNLLRKIAVALGATGENIPRPGDTNNKLLQKILHTLKGI